MRKAIILFACMAMISSTLVAQRNDCKKFHLYADCNANPGPRFKYDGQSRSNIIGVGDQLIYSLVLYENKQYVINFCTSDYFQPIHVKVMNATDDDVIYDNSEDQYLESLKLNIDQTQRLKIMVEVMAKDMSEEDQLDYFGCIGMLVKSKKIK